MRPKPVAQEKGFTMLEVMLVVASLNIFTGVGFLALNPGEDVVATRNEIRRADVATILNAVHEYAAVEGAFPALPEVDDEVCRAHAPSCAGIVNLDVLVDEGYLATIPSDPESESVTDTEYFIRLEGVVVTVSAPLAERGAAISVSR